MILIGATLMSWPSLAYVFIDDIQFSIFMQIWNCLVTNLLPIILILPLTFLTYRKVTDYLRTETGNANVDENQKEGVFRARFSFFVCGILITSLLFAAAQYLYAVSC